MWLGKCCKGGCWEGRGVGGGVFDHVLASRPQGSAGVTVTRLMLRNCAIWRTLSAAADRRAGAVLVRMVVVVVRYW